MNKRDKALARLMELPSDFTYREAVAVLAHLGFREVKGGKTGGSRIRFQHDDGEQFRMHRPHPDDVLKGYVVAELAALAMRRSGDGD